MYDLIVYDADVDDVEDFIEDYFIMPNEIFDRIRGIEPGDLGDVIVTLDDFSTLEDLMFGLRSEGFEADEL